MTDVPRSRKCSKWNSNFQNWSKALCLDVSEPTKRLAAHSTAYALRYRQGIKDLSKKMKKKYEKNENNKSKPIKSLRYMDHFFSWLMTFHYLEVATYI